MFSGFILERNIKHSIIFTKNKENKTIIMSENNKIFQFYIKVLVKSDRKEYQNKGHK